MQNSRSSIHLFVIWSIWWMFGLISGIGWIFALFPDHWHPRNILKILNYHWWSLKNDQDIMINEVKLIVFLGNPTKSPTNISFFRIILIRIAEAYNAKYWQYLKNNADAEHKWISRFIHLVHESIYTLSCIFMCILINQNWRYMS